MAAIAPPPTQESLIEHLPTRTDPRYPFYISKPWMFWLQDAVAARAQQAPVIRPVAAVSGRTSAIAATPLDLGTTAATRVRVSYYVRITTAAAVSSSLTVTINWTESGIALSASGAALTANVITAVQTGDTMLVVDANSPVTYSTSYSSNPAGQMTYRLVVVSEVLA